MAKAPSSADLKKHPKRKETRWFWDALDVYLAKKNLKQTKQRRRIVELFIDLETHLSAEELHEAVRRDGNNVGLATIYRTLNLLADAGLAEQKSFGEGRFVYEINRPGAHHDHIICLDCGAVIEFENEAIERLQEKAADNLDFSIKSHRLDLFGNCRRDPCDRRPKVN
jgi:Fur family ferric uptake transcriptional regulator